MRNLQTPQLPAQAAPHTKESMNKPHIHTATGADAPAAERFAYRPLSDDDLKQIHEATMTVLTDVGFEVHQPEAFDLFSKLDCKVDSERRIIRLNERVVMDLLSTVPPQLTLHGRRPDTDLHLGSGEVYCGTGGTALNMLDYGSDESRPANLQDLVDVIRLTEKLDNVHFMLLPTYPNELEVEDVDVNRFFAGLCHTSKHIMGGVYTSKGIADVIEMAEQVAGSPEALRQKPFISIIACGISPLRLDAKYGAYMMQVARAGVPVAVPVEPLCGATSPITLAGTLVIQNCDGLINIMTTQLANAGAPVIYGCVSSSADMRDLRYLGGPVESGLINAATAQLAHYYRIPYYATAGISDSKALDSQSGYESAINNLLVALAGGDFIHDAAGLMEFALTVSKEKLVIDNEILGMVMRACRGIEVNEKTLGVDAIQAAGPGGNFVSARHTRRNMRKEHYTPQLSDRESRDAWKAAGARMTADRAHEVVQRILGEPVSPHLPGNMVGKLLDQYPTLCRDQFSGLVN
jgi:trimethylamine--corrinoid protein Co-methyltransferase